MFIVYPITDRTNNPDKKDPGIDIPTNKPDLTPSAPKIIIRTKIIAAITLFCKLLNISLIDFDLS